MRWTLGVQVDAGRNLTSLRCRAVVGSWHSSRMTRDITPNKTLFSVTLKIGLFLTLF
jgi:hypothetical protein